MDDLDFLGELEKMEAVPQASAQPARPRATHGPKFMLAGGDTRPAALPAAVDPPATPRSNVLVVVGFALMMSIGGGAAALGFHDRVAQIVVLWSGARR